MPTCAGCDRRIADQYLLRVAPDLEWHAACLKCVDCGQPLDETRTCFVRDGKTYCRQDYQSRFTAKCTSCGVAFMRYDLVMRARDRIYHVDCFRCVVCERPLTAGDEFALTADDTLCCKADIDVVVATTSPRCGSGSGGSHENAAKSRVDDMATSVVDEDTRTRGSDKTSGSGRHFNNNNNDEVKTDGDGSASGTNSQPTPAGSGNGAAGKNSETRRTSGGSRSHKSSDQKTTRIRTVLNEKQLHTLRTCYGANPRPDALMKEQLVEMTGLSPRVIRVWFQNKRCKDKKRSILLKQIQQHHQDSAVSMVAASPIRHEPSSGLAPVPVHQYQVLPWPTFLPPVASAGALDDQLPPPGCPPYGNGPSNGGGLHHGGGPLQMQHLQDAIELQQPPPFQRLLNSFGNLTGSLSNDDDIDEDDDDDGVVSLPDIDAGSRGVVGGNAMPQQIDSRQNPVDMQHVYGHGGGSTQMTSSAAAAAAAAAILSAASSSFGVVSTKHAVRC